MADLIDRSFEELTDEYYPGSRRKRRPSRRSAKTTKTDEPIQPDQAWDSHPVRRTLREDGKPVTKEFFYIGALAAALGRRPNTIRAWIAKGWLPKAVFTTSRRVGTRGDAGRRLWTRAQIENIRQIAEEEGLLGSPHWDVTSTNFTKRVVAGFRSWR